MPPTEPPRPLSPVLAAGAIVALAVLVAPVATVLATGGSRDVGQTQVHAEIVADSTGGPVTPDPSTPSPSPASPSSPGSSSGAASFSSPVPTGTPSGQPSPSPASPSRPYFPGHTSLQVTIPPGVAAPNPAGTGGPVATVTATPVPTVTSGPSSAPGTPCPTVTTTVVVPAPVTEQTTVTYTATAAPGGTGGTTTYGPSSGWHSGASGSAATSGSFGTWRGKAVQVIAVWGDTTAAEQTEISALKDLDGFDGDVDVAVGGLASGESWSAAARGAYTERWRQAVRNIAAHRSGKPGTTYVRFAHEMNGDWFDWKVDSGNVNDFKTSWRLFHDILAQEYPAARLVFSPNSGTHSDITVSQMYPGDDLVDVIGVDFYDGWPSVLSQADWDASLYATEQGDQPRGVGSWQRFAASHGKPLSFPEWGIQLGDHPAFIKAMHDFLAANAARPGDTDLAGKVVYDVYFDVAHNGGTNFMLTGGSNPESAAAYRSLTWGS